jgi:hypothetical protein
MSACSCGDFDLPPPHRGLAEALMMNPDGPAAVVAGTDETSAYTNLLLCLGLAQDVIEKRPNTLGEAFLRFKQAAFKPGAPLIKNMLLSMEPTEKPELLADDHQYLYNLLGDPTLPLNLPHKITLSAEVTEKQTEEAGRKVFSISGALQDWDGGTAWVSFLIDRMQMKRVPTNPAGLDREEDRPAAYFERFTLANDKTAAQAKVPVTDGHFELQLAIADTLVAKVRWLQVYVHTDPTPSKTWRDGVAAQAIRLVDEQPSQK